MKKILIVEDDELIAQLERDYLEKEGFEVAIAFDGDTGLNLAGTGDFHAFILDVMLPGKSGIELCKEIRKKLPDPHYHCIRKDRDTGHSTGDRG